MLTLDFDWAVISGKRKFRWPLVSLTCVTKNKSAKNDGLLKIFYFAGRYLLLFAMIGM